MFLKNHLSLSQYLFIFFAIALQVQITLGGNGDYFGLRINAADLMLPFAGLFILWSLLSKLSYWPNWQIKYQWQWLCALMIVMSLSLYTGYQSTGALSQWAYLNKYTGFFVLISYFLMGGWFVTNIPPAKIYKYFIRALLLAFFAVIYLTILCQFLEAFIGIPLWLSHQPWDGLMANRNAFALFYIFVMLLFVCDLPKDKSVLHPWMRYCFWFSLPFVLMYNSSRAMWFLAFIILIGYLVKIKGRFGRREIILCGLGVASVFLLTKHAGHSTGFIQFFHLKNLAAEENVEYYGDQMRLIALEDAIELYKQSNKVLGAGLGSFKDYQIEKRGEFINIIDFSGLWLLTETGALGLVVFCGFFAISLWFLFRLLFIQHALSQQDEKRLFFMATFFFLISFAAMSFLHELIYTRFLWFILGIALASGTTNISQSIKTQK